MIRTLLIADDREAVELLGSLARATGELTLERVVPVVPGSYQLTRALQTLALDAILLEVADGKRASGIYEHLSAMNSDTPVITFAMNSQMKRTPFALTLPLSVAELMQTVRAAVHVTSARRKENVIAILPAKAGGGATTIVINTAARLASVFGKRVLVCESDLRSGIIAELLGLEPKASIQETLESADSPETLIWPRHVCHKDGIDFLLTRRSCQHYEPRWHDYHHLLSFVAKRYDYVLFDMPELVDEASVEIVQSARKVYLMTTPEILSLDLAHQRIADLRAMGVNDSSLRIIVNRHHSADMSAQQIQGILNCPVELVVPNNYPAVHAASLAHGFVDSRTALGRSYERCAAMIANGQHQQPTRVHKLFGFLRPEPRYDESLVVQRG